MSISRSLIFLNCWFKRKAVITSLISCRHAPLQCNFPIPCISRCLFLHLSGLGHATCFGQTEQKQAKWCLILFHGGFKSQLKSTVPLLLYPHHPHSSKRVLPLKWLQNAGVEPLANQGCEQEIKLCCSSHCFLRLFVMADTKTIIQNQRDYKNWSNMLENWIKNQL